MRTQRNIAKRVGVRHEALNRFLKGKQALSPKSLAALRRALDDIDRETAEAFSAVTHSPHISDREVKERVVVVERVDGRLRNEMTELRQLIENRVTENRQKEAPDGS